MKQVLKGTFTTSQRRMIRNEGNGKYFKASIHVTDLHGDTPSVTLKIQSPDGKGGYIDVLVDAAVTAVSSSTLEVGWDLTAVANVSAKAHVLEYYYLYVEHADAKQVDYTVTGEYGF